jgi:predicted MFS family arabinose efflux permease
MLRQYTLPMSQVLDAPKANESSAAPSAALTFMLAAAAGAIVANIYYVQPLVGLIAPSLNLPKSAASLLVTLTQLGYAVGLILLVPLGDLLENRVLIIRTVAATILALALAAASPDGTIFFIAAALIGLTATSVQMIVPMAANLAPDHMRGRVVGNVMGGLILGILFARPVGSIIAYLAGWRAVFGISAAAMLGLTFALHKILPRHQPAPGESYGGVLASIPLLMLREPVLRRRSLYQAAAFGAFSLYWTAVPLLLMDEFHYTQRGIAVFALVGAAGAIAAPIAGRLADRGWGRAGTAASLSLIMISAGASAWGAAHHDVVLLALAGVALDFGVQSNIVFGQRAIYALAPELRSRLNGAYMATFFLGGAAASAVASWLLLHGGWNAVALTDAALPALALVYFTVVLIRRRRHG